MPHPSSRIFIILSLILATAAVLTGIQAFPLIDPDEGRNAEVAREILATGDWVVPHYQGLPYLDKPILTFASVAASMRLFGVTEGAARAPIVLSAVLAASVAWLLGTRMLGRAAAGGGVVVLCSAPLFIGFSRIVIFDMQLTLFVLLAWWLAEEGRRGSRTGATLAWAAAGLGVLTKGPVALVLFLVGAVAMRWGQAPPRRMGRLFPPAGIALFAAVCVPWVASVQARHPWFLRYALLDESLERLTQPSFHRTGSPLYFLGVLLAGFLPWSFVVLGRLPALLREWRSLSRPSPERGLLLAAFGITLFFSLSASKLPGYILPAIPLLALLLGREMERMESAFAAWTRVPGSILAGIGVAFVAAVAAGLPVERWFRQPDALAPHLRTLLLSIGGLFVALGALLIGIRRTAPKGIVAAGLAACVPVAALLGVEPMRQYAEWNSSKRIAAILAEDGEARGRVAAVGALPLGLGFYLRQTIPLQSETGREMTSHAITRHFDRLRGGAEAILTEEALDARVAAGEFDRIITVTDLPPFRGWVRVTKVRGFRIWSPPGPR